MASSTNLVKEAMPFLGSQRPQGMSLSTFRRQQGTGKGAATPVVALEPTGPSRAGRYQRPGSGLDAGFLITAKDLVLGPDRLALPDPLVEIEDDAGLLHQVGIKRMDPAHLAPGPEVVFGQDPPHRTQADSDPLPCHHLPDAGGEVAPEVKPPLGGSSKAIALTSGRSSPPWTLR